MTVKQWGLIVLVALCVGAGGWATWLIVGPKLTAAKAKMDLAQDGEASAKLEVEGAATVAQAVTEHVAQTGRIVERTYELRIEAAAAPDAGAALDADRARRLGEHDRFLCLERPGLCAAAPSGDALGGADALPPLRPAADADDR